MQGNPIPTPEQIGAQPVDADLTALAALATTGLIDRTGSGTAVTRITGATGLDLLAAANAAAARTTLEITMGTWTPSFILTTSGSVNYGERAGTYLLVGDYVFFTATLSTTGLNSPSGNVRISLPFTSAGGAHPVVITASQWNTSVSTAMFSALIAESNSNTQILLRKNAAGAVASDVVAADLTTGVGNFCRISGMYRRAV